MSYLIINKQINVIILLWKSLFFGCTLNLIIFDLKSHIVSLVQPILYLWFSLYCIFGLAFIYIFKSIFSGSHTASQTLDALLSDIAWH